MAKVQIIETKNKFKSPRALIADKEERLLQMLRLMALAYHTRPKPRRKVKAHSDTVFIEVKRKQWS